jgi:pimeloyl-ACP methyl ester carboxylesterase
VPLSIFERYFRTRGQLMTAITMVAIFMGTGTAKAAVQTPAFANCSDGQIRQLLDDDPDVQVLATRAYAKDAPLSAELGHKSPKALNDLCLIKLRVGPGSPGPAGAPSTQAGIGIEIWLPTAANWNGRIHNVGGGGFVGLPQISATDAIAPSVSMVTAASQIAGSEGAVSAITDTGHKTDNAATASKDGSFLMTATGEINATQWQDFSERGIHQTALLSKKLAAAFYDQPAKYAYFEGCSTGGRQAHKHAQAFPDDYDGIIAGSPAINWTRFINADLYPQIVMQRDLDGPISPEQLNHVSEAAVSACDSSLTGEHLGYIADPSACHYNPVKDKAVLCKASGGVDDSASCISIAQANAINKIWFGQTRDGSVPDPLRDNGDHVTLAANHMWYGPQRGTSLLGLAGSTNGQGAPFLIASHQVALNLQDGTVATPDFINAAQPGADGWKKLSYAGLAGAYEQGIVLQKAFAHINTDEVDLADFRARGAKIMVFHGLADPVIPVQGTEHYYQSVVRAAGGQDQTDSFYRFYTVPGMGHCGGIGSVDGVTGVSPKADPPLPRPQQLYSHLVKWVEQGTAPDNIIIANADDTVEHPLCQYPKKLHYISGAKHAVNAYDCR